MRTRPLAMLAAMGLSIIIAYAQILLKQASFQFSWTFQGLLGNPYLIAGFVLYAGGAGLFILTLRYGKLSVLYPFLALGFIWVALLAWWRFGETLNPHNWLGIGAILLGITLVGRGEQHG